MACSRDGIKITWDPEENEGWTVRYRVESTGREGAFDLREGGEARLRPRMDADV